MVGCKLLQTEFSLKMLLNVTYHLAMKAMLLDFKTVHMVWQGHILNSGIGLVWIGYWVGFGLVLLATGLVL